MCTPHSSAQRPSEGLNLSAIENHVAVNESPDLSLNEHAVGEFLDVVAGSRQYDFLLSPSFHPLLSLYPFSPSSHPFPSLSLPFPFFLSSFVFHVSLLLLIIFSMLGFEHQSLNMPGKGSVSEPHSQLLPISLRPPCLDLPSFFKKCIYVFNVFGCFTCRGGE